MMGEDSEEWAAQMALCVWITIGGVAVGLVVATVMVFWW